MQEENEPNLQDNDRYKVSVKVLRSGTKEIISSLLNPPKIIKSEKGYLRYWQGLAELCEIPGEKIPSLVSEKDPSSKILELWYNLVKDEATVEQFIYFLEELDRFDVVDDIRESLEADIEHHKKYPKALECKEIDLSADNFILTVDDVERCRQGIREYQTYDAFVLYADDDINFATELITKMENEYDFKFCTRDRDLVGGAFEHDSIIQLIAKRCNRLIVIVSKCFLESKVKEFFYSFAQAISIEQRLRKIIPCVNSKIDYELPDKIRIYHLLDLTRADGLYNFWDKLSASIRAPSVHHGPQARMIPNGVGRSSASRSDCGLQKQLRPKDSNTVPLNHSVKFKSTSDIAEATAEETIPEICNAPTISCNSLDDRNLGQRPKKNSFYGKVKKMLTSKDTENAKKAIESGQCRVGTVPVSEISNKAEPSGNVVDECTLEQRFKNKSFYKKLKNMLISKDNENAKRRIENDQSQDSKAAAVTEKKKRKKKKEALLN